MFYYFYYLCFFFYFKPLASYLVSDPLQVSCLYDCLHFPISVAPVFHCLHSFIVFGQFPFFCTSFSISVLSFRCVDLCFRPLPMTFLTCDSENFACWIDYLSIVYCPLSSETFTLPQLNLNICINMYIFVTSTAKYTDCSFTLRPSHKLILFFRLS